MLSVKENPCSPMEYNGLSGIMEADAGIKKDQRALSQLIDAGSEAVQSTLFAHGEIGAFLLHKHWQVEDGEYMVENPGAHPTGVPALITSASQLPTSPSTAPSRFKIDPRRGQMVALEFSSDQFAVKTWHALREHMDLLESICRLISDSGVADQIGIATFARATVRVEEGEELVEENWDSKSVLSAQVPVEDKDRVLVPTGWAFVSSRDEDLTSASCIAYCMLAGGGPHCSHHYNRPEFLPAVENGMRITSPPICTLHD